MKPPAINVPSTRHQAGPRPWFALESAEQKIAPASALSLFGCAALRRVICTLGVVAMGVSPLPSWAHHSFALFDTAKTVTIKGVVSRFEFTNPHVTIYVESGEPPKRFKVESGSVNALMRKDGWKPDSIKVGDMVEIKFNPLKTEEQLGGLLVEIKDGNAVLTGGG